MTTPKKQKNRLKIIPSASQPARPISLTEKAEFFFRDPTKFQSGPNGYISSLYLLRNDLNTMNRIAADELIWFKAIGVMTGIDMVSKTLGTAGDQKTRFEQFIKSYIISSNANASRALDWSTALYYLRNGLEHSFALSHETTSGAIRYKFKVVYNEESPLIATYASKTQSTRARTITIKRYQVNIKKLELAFEAGVKRYFKATKRGAPFSEEVFDKIGCIKI